MSLKLDIDDFLLYCQLTKQFSYNTVRNYKNTLERLLEFMESHNIVVTKDIDLRAVNEYRKYLSTKESSRNKEMALKSQGYQIVVLRSFLKFLKKQGMLVLDPDKLELPKARMRRVEYLTEEEIQKLITAILQDSNKIKSIQKKRNVAMIMAMFGSGLRLSEVLKLTVKEINNPDGRLMVEGKGGKIRTTYLPKFALEAIQEYMSIRSEYNNQQVFEAKELGKNIEPDSNPYLFVSFSKNAPKSKKKQTHLTQRMVQMIIQKYANSIGIYKHITPHTLRHSFATKILFEGGDIRSVQILLGHSNIATTQIYTHITDWQIQELHSKVFKTSDLKTKETIKKKRGRPFKVVG
jgi:site-specific recombinase XerD